MPCHPDTGCGNHRPFDPFRMIMGQLCCLRCHPLHLFIIIIKFANIGYSHGRAVAPAVVRAVVLSVDPMVKRKDPDGREIHREAEIPNGVPGFAEIDYGSPLTLGASIGKVERAISGGMSGVAKGIHQSCIFVFQ